MEQTIDISERINRLVKELEQKGVRFFLAPGGATEFVFSFEKGDPSDPKVYIGREVSLEKLVEHLETIKQELGEESYA